MADSLYWGRRSELSNFQKVLIDATLRPFLKISHGHPGAGKRSFLDSIVRSSEDEFGDALQATLGAKIVNTESVKK